MTTTLQISVPSLIGADNYSLLFNPETEGLDKTYSIEITTGEVELIQSIYYDGDGNKKLNLNGNITDCMSGLDVQVGLQESSLTAVLRSTNGLPYAIRTSSETSSTVGIMLIGSVNGVTGGNVIDNADALNYYINAQTNTAVDILISFDIPTCFPSANVVLNGGLMNPIFQYTCTREDGTSFSLNISARTPITDTDGVTYTKQIILNNLDGTPVEVYDITGNVTFDLYQASALVNDGMGNIYIDPENAPDLISPTNRYYDGFLFKIITVEDLLNFGGYIIIGGSPDDFLILDDMTRAVPRKTRKAVKRIKSNLGVHFEIAKQKADKLEALRTLML